jgi:hypothetical protein
MPANDLKMLGLRVMPQHMAPSDLSVAWQNLWYSRFANEQPFEPQPQWLQQLPAGYLQLQASQQWLQRWPQLVSLVDTMSAPAQMRWHLVDDIDTALAGIRQADPDSIQLLLPLTASANQFALGKVSLWYRWDALRKLDQVTQQLDLVPTLLAQLGCYNQQTWHGDNLLIKTQAAKLNIIAGQLYMFRKDKMQLMNQDGEFSVWSAGSGVRLEQKLDLPLLTDALKRLPNQP